MRTPTRKEFLAMSPEQHLRRLRQRLNSGDIARKNALTAQREANDPDTIRVKVARVRIETDETGRTYAVDASTGREVI